MYNAFYLYFMHSEESVRNIQDLHATYSTIGI